MVSVCGVRKRAGARKAWKRGKRGLIYVSGALAKAASQTTPTAAALSPFGSAQSHSPFGSARSHHDSNPQSRQRPSPGRYWPPVL